MIKRPSATDTEDDLVQMQKDFLLEKYKDENFQPAAKVVKLTKPTTREPSKFAKQREQQNKAAQTTTTEAPIEKNGDNSTVLGDIIERKPTPTSASIIIGDIVEKLPLDFSVLDLKERQQNVEKNTNSGFPKPMRIQRDRIKPIEGKSLFAVTRGGQQKQSKPMEAMPFKAPVHELPPVAGTSNDIDSSNNLIKKLTAEVHEENMKKLQQMDVDEIIQEREKIIESLDPSLIEFLKSRRKHKPQQQQQLNQAATIETEETAKINTNEIYETKSIDICSINSTTKEILDIPGAKNWPNFNTLEPAKLEWMKDLPKHMPTLKPGETYEARFDWKGVLMPYSMDTISESDRELYFHGDDAERPGYTLQELFRLARSNIAQQRISAITSINGIINIYHQGFYDNVLDVPISKIFFLLRFSFDENIAAILEITSKALATLFYNETDELLLDHIFECSLNCEEPSLAIPDRKSHDVLNNDEDDDAGNDGSLNKELEKQFSGLRLNNDKINNKRGGIFQMNISDNDNDDQESRESLNDFHLAEVDLIECSLRTNILQRINYVLFIVKAENSTVLNCLKILIRLARTDHKIAESMFDNNLIKNICHHFIPVDNDGGGGSGGGGAVGGAGTINTGTSDLFYNKPQYLAIKFVRILCEYGQPNIRRQLIDYGLIASLKSYLFVQTTMITISVIKLQIEAYRLAKLLILSLPTAQANEFYCELMPAMLYMLEWNYEFTNFTKPEHSIFRQHAAALINLIISIKTTTNNYYLQIQQFNEKFDKCFSKWFYMASTKDGVTEFSQNILLATCITATHQLLGSPVNLTQFLQTYFMNFLKTNSFSQLFKDLCKTSPLLSPHLSQRSRQHLPLPNLQSVIIDTRTKSPTFIVAQNYSIYLLNATVCLVNKLSDTNLANILIDQFINDLNLLEYFDKIVISQQSSYMSIQSQFKGNWFLQTEIEFLMNCMKNKWFLFKMNKRNLQTIAYMVTCWLTINQLHDVGYLFENIIFNEKLYDDDKMDVEISSEMSKWKRIYAIVCLKSKPQMMDSCRIISNYNRLVLSNDWPYQPLMIILRSVLQKPSDDDRVKVAGFQLNERDLISAVISFTSQQKLNQLHFINPTEELIFLMVTYLGPECTFLELDIKELLAKRVKEFFTENKTTTFDFDQEYNGNITFENLYILFLDHFQGTSYGDEMFGALVMLPLAQKYHSKWRLMVWSEHLSVLRFIACKEEQICGVIEDYLEPVETDMKLLKCYYQAIHSITFMDNSLPYRIAKYHLAEAKKNMLANNNLIANKLNAANEGVMDLEGVD